MIKHYINEILLFITGGGMIQLLNYFRDKRRDKGDEYGKIVEYYKTLLLEIRDSEQECKASIDKLKDLYSELNAKVIVLESAHFDLPFPMSLKSLDGKMISVNTEYENLLLAPLGKTAKDYIGKTDAEIWGVELAQSYAVGDRMAMKSKNGYWSGEEQIIINNIDYSKDWYSIKYVRYAGKTPIGIGGILIPKN